MKTAKPIRMPLRRAPKRPRPASTPLRARAATADEAYDEEDYEGETEPNMKLSHAFIVVLVLHLIAVGGILGFNAVKVRQNAESKSAKASAVPEIPRTVEAAPEAATPVAAAQSTAPKATAPASPTTASGKTYTVAAGDTLGHIATKNGTTVEAIEKENGITSYSTLHVGQVLKMPAKSSAKPAAVAAKPAPAKPTEAPTKPTVAEKTPEKPTASAPAATEGDVYVVVKGDNPYSIAKKLHVSYNDLIAANGIKDATKIQIGQKLKVPSTKN